MTLDDLERFDQEIQALFRHHAAEKPDHWRPAHRGGAGARLRGENQEIWNVRGSARPARGGSAAAISAETPIMPSAASKRVKTPCGAGQ